MSTSLQSARALTFGFELVIEISKVVRGFS
jgi:hypothetical protein